MNDAYKIATWNINSLRVRLTQLINWIAEHQPDIIALQEIKVEDQHFPISAIQEIGYHAVYAGQKSYNGVAILSRNAASSEIITDLHDFSDTQRRVLCASYGDLRIINLYVPNGSSIGSEKYFYKLNWLAKLNDFLKQEIAKYPKLIVLGDFNIAPEDRDVHDPIMWEGQVQVSPPEREALAKVLGLGFVDAYRLFEQEGGNYSWWDYRAGAFRRNHGLRIDHILLSHALKDSCVACMIDKAWRAQEQPSDHAPVVATLQSL